MSARSFVTPATGPSWLGERVACVRRTAMWLLALTWALCAWRAEAAPTEAARKITPSQLRRNLTQVRSRINEKRSAIRVVKRQERRITGEIEDVEDRLLRAESRLEYVKRRLGELERQRKALTERIAATERRLSAQRRVLALRLRQTYQQGRDGYMHVLLKSRSMHEYMARSYYVERIVDSDVRLIARIRADERQLRADRRTLERQASEQRALKVELIAQSAAYRSHVDRKRDLLADVRSTRRSLEEALDVLEDASRAITARIRALQTTPKGRVRLLRTWSGRFIQPASGRVTSPFGMRYHPILHRRRMHTGVDIGASYGSSIRAAADGDVIMASYMRGYGNTVIVDHGGSVTTLYAHCSSLLVRDGQRVRQGQTIARVGSTGLSTGPHLHFEVRHNGTPVNPR